MTPFRFILLLSLLDVMHETGIQVRTYKVIRKMFFAEYLIDKELKKKFLGSKLCYEGGIICIYRVVKKSIIKKIRNMESFDKGSEVNLLRRYINFVR